MRRSLIALAIVTGCMLAAGVARADDLSLDLGDFTLSTGLGAGGAASRGLADSGAGPERLVLSASLRHELTGANLVVGGGVIGDDRGVYRLGIDPPALASQQNGYRAFAQLGLAGFTVGGGYVTRYDETVGADDPLRHTYSLGASYALEDWTFGLDWARGDYDEVFLDVGNGDSGDTFAFTSSYALGPGVRINGLLEYGASQSSTSDSDAGALAVGIGTLINF